MKVVCYGDSNTFGYNPRGYFGGQYDHPWPEILAAKTGWSIVNDGVNSREIPKTPIFFPEDTDLLIIMLGTNDLLQGASSEAACEKMERFLEPPYSESGSDSADRTAAYEIRPVGSESGTDR